MWTEKFINPNKYSRPQKKMVEVRKVVIHYTANLGATAMNHFNYFNNLKDVYASAHFFIDKAESLLIIPLDEIAYHANDGSYRGVLELKPNANFLSVGIELCMEKDGSFHPNTIKQAEDVAVELCKRYKLNPMTDIVRHYDITHKNCPAPWVKDVQKFFDFKDRVNDKFIGKCCYDCECDCNKEIQVEKPVAPKPVTPTKPVTQPTLKEGDKGQSVKDLQTLLNKKGYKLKVDGDFGKGTSTAVKDFQKKNKLTVDGIVGKATWTKLK